MCRIVGIKDKDSNASNTVEILKKMRDSLSHGGPDGFGLYSDDQIVLGHRRLSILDLSEAGKQPMQWQHLVITFNGEVYNFAEIKIELQKYGYTFITGTDTEVILKSFDKWGLEAVQRYRGMFAFAIWDKKTQKLTICRDRVGVKPLFWYQKDGLFMFASELKAFHEHPDFDKTIDLEAVSLFLQKGYIQAPFSIYKQVRKLKPGSFLILDKTGKIELKNYWEVEKMYQNTPVQNRKEEQVVEEVEQILKESFQYRMVADVPVGMFLSGGIDSSLVTAMIQAQSSQPVRTFTIGFHDEAFNEAKHAKNVSAHLGTEHTELYCTGQEFEKLIPRLPEFFDEPFGAGSAIPTFMVSQLAKETVKVSLSADGGDEIFAGYTKYEIAQKWQQKIAPIPSFAKKGLSGLIGLFNPQVMEDLAPQIPFLKNYTNIGSKFFKAANALNAKNIDDFFNISSSYVTERELKQLFSVFAKASSSNVKPKPQQLLSYLGMLDMKSYLEGEIMTKVDRATMHTALEGREPFLDQNIIEYAFSIPDNLKIKDGVPKYLLREILYKYVPKKLIERPKQGFDIPVKDWLRGFLRNELEEMVTSVEFLEDFQFNQPNLRGLIEDFLEQKRYVNPQFVWFLYVLFKWHLRWK